MTAHAPIDPDLEECRDGRISDWIGYGACWFIAGAAAVGVTATIMVALHYMGFYYG